MKVISNEEWEKSKRDGEPSLTLDAAEAQVLERFLRYWLGDVDDGPIYRPQGANVVYDY